MKLTLPNVLHNSVDFSTFEAISTTVLCAMKSKVDKITDIRSAEHCPINMLKTVCESFGCPYFEDAPLTTRKILNSWWNFMRSKGTRKTMEAVASLAVEVLYEKYSLTPVSGSFDITVDVVSGDQNNINVSYQGVQPTPTMSTAELNTKCENLILELLSYVAPVCGIISFMPSVIETITDVLEAVETVETVELPLEDNPQLISVSKLALDDTYRICYGQHNLPNSATLSILDESVTGTKTDNILTLELENTNILDNSITLTLGQITISNHKSISNMLGDYQWNSNDILSVGNTDNTIKIIFRNGASIPTSASVSYQYSVPYVCNNCPNITSCTKLTREGVGVAEDSVLNGTNRDPGINWEYPTVIGNTIYIPQSYHITKNGDTIYIE